LTGIIPWTGDGLDALAFFAQASQLSEATTADSGGDTDGVTFAERFARYKSYGITYVEAENASGAGNRFCLM